MRRRNVVRSLGFLLVSPVAGCSLLRFSSFLEIAIVNSSEEPHSVEIELRQGDDVRFEQTTWVEPYAERTDGDRSFQQTIVRFDGIRTGTEYTLVAELDGEHTNESTVTVDCSAEDGGDEFTARIHDDWVEFHDRTC